MDVTWLSWGYREYRGWSVALLLVTRYTVDIREFHTHVPYAQKLGCQKTFQSVREVKKRKWVIATSQHRTRLCSQLSCEDFDGLFGGPQNIGLSLWTYLFVEISTGLKPRKPKAIFCFLWQVNTFQISLDICKNTPALFTNCYTNILQQYFR